MGTITLYNHYGDILAIRAYHNNFRFKKILEDWKMLYGPRPNYQKFYYQIAPETVARVKSKAA
jgi:hypothetical protein